MRILVIGTGAREHALCWKFAKHGHQVESLPGNPGMAALGRVHAVAAEDHAAVLALCQRESYDLIVVGPEAPLVAGLADQLRAAGCTVFGPSAAGAKLEGSKVFAKEFFRRHDIPTAEFAIAQTVGEADAIIDRLGGALVVKADGLAAGKGVIVCGNRDEARAAARQILAGDALGSAGHRIVIERKIEGREISILAITDGKRFEVLPTSEDHKTIFDGDKGPNTGGMGTVCPGWAPERTIQRAIAEIFTPTLVGLVQEGIDFRGVLYAGVMIDREGRPWMLEYNCRFGDPEAQSILMSVAGDLAPVMLGAALGKMPIGNWRPREGTVVCVTVAAAGYPAAPRRGDTITGVSPEHDGVVTFHAGTATVDDKLISAGGRVLSVTAHGRDLTEARHHAYTALSKIALDGMQFRTDIGLRPRL